MYLMNKIKLVAFDLDGTIADTLSLCIKAFRMAVQPYISQTLSEDDIIKTFGLNEEGMIRKVIKMNIGNRPYKILSYLHEIASFYVSTAISRYT